MANRFWALNVRSGTLRHSTPDWPERDGAGFQHPPPSPEDTGREYLAVNIPHRGSQGPLQLLIDIEPVSATGSSGPARGIKVEGEGEWSEADQKTIRGGGRFSRRTRKHGGPKRPSSRFLEPVAKPWLVWRKVHLGIDEQTLEIRAAVIPPRRNAKPWKTATAGAVARNEALRASKHLGRALWRRWSGYHRRSRAETKMHFVKLLGQRLMARDFDRRWPSFK